MTIKILIVDDSAFFQHRLKEMLQEHPEFEVVGMAANGIEAVEKAKTLRPDVITMDYEMPLMDGVTAVRHIMSEKPVPILMFSSLTYEGARTTLDALEAGAVDFLPKVFTEVSNNSALLKKKLHDRIVTIARKSARSHLSVSHSGSSVVPPKTLATKVAQTAVAVKPVTNLKGKVKLLLIGASTGGPVALTQVIKQLPAHFPLPIVLIQHMPENFTKAFAERLNLQARINVHEAKNGDILKPGTALLAPGGKQLMIDKSGVVRILPGDDRVNYRPSLDITFGSAANSFGNRVLGVVLTGMGSDGCEGARLIKQAGGAIWSQDQQSSVIYGMPMAVAKANLTDCVMSLNEIGSTLAEAF